MKSKRLKATIAWIPGHVDIEGNELADVGAKLAAAGHTSPRESLPSFLRINPRGKFQSSTLQRSLSAAKQLFMENTKASSRALWTTSPRFRHLAEIDSSLPSERFLKLTKPLPRRYTSLLYQLRS